MQINCNVRVHRALIAAFALALAGCGGGGGSSTPPPTPPTATPPPPTTADATRFLAQSSFGVTDASLAAVTQVGLSAYIDQQAALPATGYSGYSYVDPNVSVTCPTGSPPTCFRDNFSLFSLQAQFFRNALTGQDQLRQRVAWALSQIFVTSGIDIKSPYAMAAYQQILLDDAFGSFRKLLYDVTLSPAMGRYLDMANNDKPNAAKGTSPNENYAREVLQLLSIGLVQLNADGTPKLDANGNQIPTYDQNVVEGFAYVFTGWTYPTMPGATAKWPNPPYYLGQMVLNPAHHDTSAKTLLNGFTVPANQDGATDLNQAIDNIANHSNVGPFIGKQLIQNLVTSNPSPAYVARVSAVFDNNGAGVRGDLKAVVKAILLDPEARGDIKTDPTYGKLREPVIALTSLIRGAGGSSASDGVALLSAASAMEQPVFYSASVFNYYPPDYPLQGTTLVAPAFGIYNATTALSRANTFARMLSGPIAKDASVAGSTGTLVDIGPWQSIAADPNALVDRIDTVFFHKSMSAPTRSTLVSSISTVPATDTLTRAKVGLYLALTAQQTQVEQ